MKMSTTTPIETFDNLSSVVKMVNLFGTPEKAEKLLFDQGIFPSTMECSNCGNSIKLNGQSFRCGRRTCRLRVSARDGTFFSKMKTPLEKVLFYLYYFISGASANQIMSYLQISSKTIASLNRYTRQLLADAVDQSDVTIGGLRIIVEIDESKFEKVKYHRGHRVKGAWVLGDVEKTEEQKLFAGRVTLIWGNWGTPIGR
uniref:Zn_Tnp_IS1 domain-containing protein n=2 Tax=Strongyloides stercoralis TaxID=6248 RepID=A0A0K0EDJ4_STRER